MPFAKRYLVKKRSPTIALVLLVSSITFIAGIAIGIGKGVEAGRQSAHELLSAADGGNPLLQGNVTGIGSRPPKGTTEDVEFALFWKVWNDLKNGFYKQPVLEKQLFYGALQGMADALGDPYTVYFEPQVAEDFVTSLEGEFSGIGAEIGVKDGELQIITPLPDSPAERAGIKTQDLILEIDGVDSLAMPVEEAVHRIRGTRGTNVILTIGRRRAAEGDSEPELETLDIMVTRDTIVVPVVRSEEVKPGIYHISIYNFNSNALEAFHDEVDAMIEDGATGVIIDVRNNPGGYLDRAIELAGEWLKDRVVVVQRERGVITQEYKGTGRGRMSGFPTVVLVNEGSASASEILAGALRDYGVAWLVGKTTFGKGSVQDFREYDDGSALKFTVAEWLTPSHTSINEEGIAPDFEISITEDDITAERDPQLEKAIELIQSWEAPSAKF